MNGSRNMVIAGVVAVGLAGTVALPLLGAAHGWSDSGMTPWPQADRIDSHIALLKSELGITAAQGGEWRKVAQAMRHSASTLGSLRARLEAERHDPQDAIERLALQQQIMQAKAQAITDFATAFKPLYDRLNDDQRKAADALLRFHGYRG
ncbi:MAG TPA: Spy/CpxP family protein refolding chaperone [Alphaproteobacteria bacterium]|nr:Spy/CpxP family protein refolding chaperone [Alphaproteobacteria bacterium]